MLESPLQVDAEVLGRMQDLFRSAVRKIRGHMVNRIGMEVPVRFGEVGFVTHHEIQEQFLNESSAIYVTFEISGHRCALGIDTTLLFRIMGLLLGEDPYGEPSIFEGRPPTRMDMTIAKRLALDVFAGLSDSLPADTGAELKVLTATSNPRLDLPYPRTALMIDAALDFGPAEDPYGLMAICMPVSVAKALWPNTDAPAPRPINQGINRVMPIPLTVVAELTRVQVAYSQLSELQVGQMVDLGSVRDVTVSIAGKPAMKAEAGAIDGVRCVKVVRRVNTANNDSQR